MAELALHGVAELLAFLVHGRGLEEEGRQLRDIHLKMKSGKASDLYLDRKLSTVKWAIQNSVFKSHLKRIIPHLYPVLVH